MVEPALRNFLEIPYDELEALNLEAKNKVVQGKSEASLRKHYISYLEEEKRIKAVTVCFCNLEGCLHMLDYDKKHIIDHYDNLTFDGSSIRGFSNVTESDLRLAIDWESFRWLPSDVFGPGKVVVFGIIQQPDGTTYPSDFRGHLKEFTNQLRKKDMIANVAVECEGFLFQGLNAEQHFNALEGFDLVSSGGYFHSLPKDPLKLFIDAFAEAKRAMGFENEKDHPEVAPSQFELNYKYCDALLAADQVLLYKLIARQIAANMGMTACFLPKPIAGINGSGMHTNISISKGGKNLFFDKKGEASLSSFAWSFVDRILHSANDICLTLNPSVNAYRRLDPAYEAPNQIKSSAVDRTSMVRVPLGNENSARIEVRTVSPDVNPYLAFFTILKTGLEGPENQEDTSDRRTRTKFLPSNVYDAMRHFKSSDWITNTLGAETKDKYFQLKSASADRCPRELGELVKTAEVIFHHEITNQYLWSRF